VSSASEFRALHVRGKPIILVNVWDATTAAIVEAAGFPALATSSLALAGAAGYEDGQNYPFAEMLAAASRIKAATSKPLSVDCEAGYADDADGVRVTIAAIVAAGMAGINLEDGLSGGRRELVDVDLAQRKVAAARAQANANGGDLHVNARVDTFILSEENDPNQVHETIRRGHAYAEAGADSIFVPYLGDLRIIEHLVDAIPLPINILMLSGYPTVAQLANVGVGRISLGSFPFRWFQKAFKKAVADFAGTGAPEAFAPTS